MVGSCRQGPESSVQKQGPGGKMGHLSLFSHVPKVFSSNLVEFNWFASSIICCPVSNVNTHQN